MVYGRFICLKNYFGRSIRTGAWENYRVLIFLPKKKLKVIFLHLSPLIARTYVDLCLRKLDYHICENSNKEYENVEKLKYFSRSFK